jgi:protein TonB
MIMSVDIKNISLKFVCQANWDGMKAIDGGKYCSHCQKIVYDFTNAKQREFLQILAENNGNICGKFTTEQMAYRYPVLPAWKKWVSAAIIILGFNFWGSRLFAQKRIDAIADTNAPDKQLSTSFGTVEVVPEFPGGLAALVKFIKINLRKVEGAQGKRLIASFVVEKDGSLTGISITRGINEEADKEAIRVLKLSPKWKPGMQNNKPLKVAYSIPINFN